MDHTIVASTATRTHDFSAGHWGHKAEILKIINAGQWLRLAVWTQARLEVGDYLILANGAHTTRYRVEGVERQHDPADMSFVDVSFAPRQEVAV